MVTTHFIMKIGLMTPEGTEDIKKAKRRFIIESTDLVFHHSDLMISSFPPTSLVVKMERRGSNGPMKGECDHFPTRILIFADMH